MPVAHRVRVSILPLTILAMLLIPASVQAQVSIPPTIPATHQFANLLNAIRARNYAQEIKDGTQEFQRSDTQTAFNSVCDQISARLNDKYAINYIAGGYANGRQVYQWQLGFSDGLRVTAQMSVLNGRVDSFFLKPVRNPGQPPSASTIAHYNHLIAALKQRNYRRFVQDGTHNFRVGITQAMFNSVCSQITGRLKGKYTSTFAGSWTLQGRHIYEWQLNFPGSVKMDARLVAYQGLVDGFVIIPANS